MKLTRPLTMLHLRVLAATLVAAATLTGATALPAPAAHAGTGAPSPGSVPPDQDPFYTAPADIASFLPGQVVANRPVRLPEFLAPTVHAWQISYRTNDSHLQPELAVTTLLVPTAAWTGPGPRPVVSQQMPEDSTGTQCAPSYGLASGGVFGVAWAALAQPLLANRWAVAIPDFEGPKSVFMAGLQAGHAVLDGIRAVQGFPAAGITGANPWALNGYSGGAEATGWAAQLQPSYAPGLVLAGAAMGGTPADPAALARFLDGGVFSGFEIAATVSLNTEYPDLGLEAVLNTRGEQLLTAARGKCVTDLLTGFPFRKLSDYTTVPDPLAIPSVTAVLTENTLGAAAPRTPVYDYHAHGDEIVPVAQDDVTVAAWCARHATVQQVRHNGGEHALELVTGKPGAMAFLSDRFAGRPAPSTC